MKAYRIQNDIFAAPDAQAAIAAWAEHYNDFTIAAGPIEEVSPDLEISIEEEDGTFRTGKLSEVIPIDGPAMMICEGEHPDT